MKAGASAFGNVDNMVLLNGADGMADMFAKALTMGGTGLGLARQLLASMNQDGQAPERTSALNGSDPAGRSAGETDGKLTPGRAGAGQEDDPPRSRGHL